MAVAKTSLDRQLAIMFGIDSESYPAPVDLDISRRGIRHEHLTLRGKNMEGATLGRGVCGHHSALAPLPLCRAHESRCAAFRPQKVGQCWHRMRCQAAKDADELQLVKREGASLACPSTCMSLQFPTMASAEYPRLSAIGLSQITRVLSAVAWSFTHQQPLYLLTLDT